MAPRERLFVDGRVCGKRKAFVLATVVRVGMQSTIWYAPPRGRRGVGPHMPPAAGQSMRSTSATNAIVVVSVVTEATTVAEQKRDTLIVHLFSPAARQSGGKIARS
jgi:hypothetical protein